MNSISEYLEGISNLPYRGTKREDFGPGMRAIGFDRAVTIVFVVEDDRVLINSVFYRGRDVEARVQNNED